MDIRKGSFTVEASFIFPILFFTIIAAMRIGLSRYTDTKNECQQYMAESQWSVKEFYTKEWVQKVVNVDD